MSTEHREAVWREISDLPVLADVVAQGIDHTEAQIELFERARPKPYVLDDATLDRARAAFTTQREDLWYFEEQTRRWSKQALSEAQRIEVDALDVANRRLRERTEATLALIEELAAGTIEKTMDKSDFQLGLEALLGDHGKHR
jgi:hypothetical protein